jgi:hypothetical protein
MYIFIHRKHPSHQYHQPSGWNQNQSRDLSFILKERAAKKVDDE